MCSMRSVYQLPLYWEGWSDFPSHHANSHLKTGLVWPLRTEAQGPPIPKAGPFDMRTGGKNTFHLWELGTTSIPGLWSLPCLAAPWASTEQCQAGDRQELAELSAANTLLLLPAATCCTWWQLLFLYWNSLLAYNLCVTSWEPDLALW